MENIISLFDNTKPKALPDPYAKYTTMDKFLKSYEIKRKYYKFNFHFINFFDRIFAHKSKIKCVPIVYSKKTGYKNPKSIKETKKNNSLVIPLINT